MKLSRLTTRHLICLACLLAVTSTPLLAQTGIDGIDLLDADQVLRADESSGESEGAVTVRAALDEGPRGVILASHDTDTLRYDDGEFENFGENGANLAPAAYGGLSAGGLVEWAQRFEVAADSTVVSARACFLRPEGDLARSLDFTLRFYGNVAANRQNQMSHPGLRSGFRYTIEEDIRRAGNTRCALLEGALVGKRLRKGTHWVGIEWNTATMKRLAGDHYTNDDEAETDRNDEAVHETEVRWRPLPVAENAPNDGWIDARNIGPTETTRGLKAIGVSLVVAREHAEEPDPDPDPEPDPDPDPDPEPAPEDDVRPGPLTAPPTGAGYTNCLPSASRLVFDGDYRVSLCYETADGTKGEARAGIYKSSKSGLLWFFDNENAEVLIKVLDGCEENGHRWVFMAAATDLAFNLYVTDGRSRTWSYHNKQGEAAVTQNDTMALRCGR